MVILADHEYPDVQHSSFIMLFLWLIGMDHCISKLSYKGTILQRNYDGAQWLSGRVLDSRLKGGRFEAHWGHCIVFLEQDTFILA